jgi:hypothetical protein
MQLGIEQDLYGDYGCNPLHQAYQQVCFKLKQQGKTALLLCVFLWISRKPKLAPYFISIQY